jgi:uncharacterized membrane protein
MLSRAASEPLPLTAPTTTAAVSRSLVFRAPEDRVSSEMASSWVQRFCAMITPTAMSMVARDFMAAAISSLASCRLPSFSASRSDFAALATKFRAVSMSSGERLSAFSAYRFTTASASPESSSGMARMNPMPCSLATPRYSGHRPSRLRSGTRTISCRRRAVRQGPSSNAFWSSSNARAR